MLAVQLAATVLALVMTGCAARVPYPADWHPVLEDAVACTGPSGSFANAPVASSNTTPHGGLQLTEVFFGDLLGGFEVTHLHFEPLAGGELRITPWVGAVPLRQTRTLEPSSRRCDADRWQLSAGWEGDGYSTATAVFMTAGMLMPLASKVDFSLRLNSDGQLVVHVRQHSVNTVALLIPFRTRDREAWHAYRRYAPAGGSDAP